MNSSKFNLWRASFSFCFVDGVLDEEEQEWVELRLSRLAFTPEQKNILLKDLRSPPDIEGLLPLITSPADRGFLVNNIRMLAHIDYDLEESEKDKIKQTANTIIQKLNLPELQQSTKMVTQLNTPHDFVDNLIGELIKKIDQ